MVSQHSGQAIVANLDRHWRLRHPKYVVRLQITVQNLILVHKIHTLHDLQHNPLLNLDVRISEK